MSRLKDDSQMPFGMHSDKKMIDVPAKYLLWFWDQNEEFFKSGGGSRLGFGQRRVMEYIEENFEVLQDEINHNFK